MRNALLFWLFLGWFPLFWFRRTPYLLNNRMADGRGSRILGSFASLAMLLLIVSLILPAYYSWVWIEILFWVSLVGICIPWGGGGYKIYYFRDEAMESAGMTPMKIKSAPLKSVSMQL